MIRALLFDLGNVLLLFSHERMCAQIAAECGLSQEEVWQMLFETDLVQRWDRGELSELELHHAIEQQTERPLNRSRLVRAASDIFELNSRMPPILRQLKRQGYRLVLLSNTNSMHVDWIREHYDIFDMFDAWVLSYEVHAIKPDPAIFTEACRRAEAAPAECFYTDDIRAYVDRARQLGIDAEQFVGVDTLLDQLSVRGIRVEC